MGSWSLPGPSTEGMTSAPLEEAPECRAWRVHYGRPCGSSGAIGRCLSVPLFGFACVGDRETKECHRIPSERIRGDLATGTWDAA